MQALSGHCPCMQPMSVACSAILPAADSPPLTLRAIVDKQVFVADMFAYLST